MNQLAAIAAPGPAKHTGFNAAALAEGYQFLDACPERFLDAAITLPFGDLASRVQGLATWRAALLAGVLPACDGWPGESIAAPARQALADMRIARICKDCPELVDQLLTDIVESFARHNQMLQQDIAQRLRELAAARVEAAQRPYAPAVAIWPPVAARPHPPGHLRRPRQVPAAAVWPPQPIVALPANEVQLSKKAASRLRDQAAREVGGRVKNADSYLLDNWDERARAWSALADVFDDLGQMLGCGSDLSLDLTLGVLRHTGWRKLVGLRQLVKRLPQLRKIVQALGQLHVSAQPTATVAEQVFIPMRRPDSQWQENPLPLIAEETRGIERSDAIARMLPVEATMLGHPKLRLLWHARRAEQALLTYRAKGVELEKKTVARQTVRNPRRERGPILAIIDSSGSMGGAPEQIAKALVLEALRTARREKRRCLLYTFSGPGQIAQHELVLSAQGVGELLEFLGLSFSGGSDPTRAIEEVLARIGENEWKQADVFCVSDGEWLAATGAGCRCAASGQQRNPLSRRADRKPGSDWYA